MSGSDFEDFVEEHGVRLELIDLCHRAYLRGKQQETSTQLAMARDRIHSLEAPFILTDTPPKEPGWYVVKDHNGVMTVEPFSCLLVFNDYKLWGYKWGSAPLPLPRGED